MMQIYEFTILHEGWEMDNKGWIEQQPDGTLKLITTSHGRQYTMSYHELKEKIIETETSLKGLRRAMELMGWLKR